MVNDKEFGKLIAMTEANSDAIKRTNALVDKNRANIVWLYRFGVTVLLGVVLNALVVPNIKFKKDEIKKETIKPIENTVSDCYDYLTNREK